MLDTENCQYGAASALRRAARLADPADGAKTEVSFIHMYICIYIYMHIYTDRYRYRYRYIDRDRQINR